MFDMLSFQLHLISILVWVAFARKLPNSTTFLLLKRLLMVVMTLILFDTIVKEHLNTWTDGNIFVSSFFQRSLIKRIQSGKLVFLVHLRLNIIKRGQILLDLIVIILS